MTVQVFYPSPVDALVSALPLKEMDASLLSRAILTEVYRYDLDLDLFESAIAFASWAHRNQTRAQRGSMPRVHYIEHPLRVCNRLLRYGVTDQDVLLAAILHDTVEDHAMAIAVDVMGGVPRDEQEARLIAMICIRKNYGEGVARIVRGLSNPISADGLTVEDAHAEYRAHVEHAIRDTQVAIVKFSDFEDNAGGLHHNVGPGTKKMVAKLAKKYWPLVPVFSERISRADFAPFVPADGRKQMREHIDGARVTLRRLHTI